MTIFEKRNLLTQTAQGAETDRFLSASNLGEMKVAVAPSLCRRPARAADFVGVWPWLFRRQNHPASSKRIKARGLRNLCATIAQEKLSRIVGYLDTRTLSLTARVECF